VYNTSVPLATGAVDLTAFFSTVGSVTAVYQNGVPIPLVNGTISPNFLLLPAQVNTITIVSTQDGTISLNITRRASDISSLTSIAYDQHLNPTAGVLSPAITAGVYTYTVTVPFSAQNVNLSATSGFTPFTIQNGGLLTMDPLNPANNVLTVNSLADGIYTILFVSAPPDIHSLVLQHADGQTLIVDATLNTGIAQIPYVAPAGPTAGSQWAPWDAHVQYYQFLVPFAESSVGLYFNYSKAGSIGIDYVNGINGPLVVVVPPVGVNSYPNLHLAVGWNTFHLNSTQDGFFHFDVWRAFPDVLDFTIAPSPGAVAPAGAPALPTTLVLSPAFLLGSFEYTVPVTIPIYVTAIVVTGKYTVPGAFYIANGSFPIPIPNDTTYSQPLKLAVGVNNVSLVSTQDGTFHVLITRAGSDLTSLGLTGYDTMGAPAYSPSLVPAFKSGVFEYTVSVPYGMLSASDFESLQFGTTTSSGGHSYATSMPLVSGAPNTYTITSSIDGDYTITILRRPEDLAALAYEGHNVFLNYWQNLFLSGRTKPKYVAGTEQFEFNSTVKFEVQSVRFTAAWTSFPDPNTRYTIYAAPNGTKTALQYHSALVHGVPSMAVPLAIGRNIVILSSNLDGNRTFNVFRNFSLANACLTFPCQHNGVCAQNYSIAYDTYFTCACVQGYSGAYCEIGAGPTAPPLFDRPVAVLSSTATVLGNCDQLILDARSSHNQLTAPSGAYIDPASVKYSFFVNRMLTTDGIDLIATNAVPTGVNITLGSNIGTFPYAPQLNYLIVPGFNLLGNVTYEIGLVVSNDAIDSDPTFIRVSKLMNDTCIPWMPKVAIQPPAVITRPRLNVFKLLMTPGIQPLPLDAIVTFQWSVSIRQAGIDVDTLTSSIYPTHLKLTTRDLSVPPYWLVVKETYYLHLVVSITSPSGGGFSYRRRLLVTSASVSGQADCTVTVYVPPSALVADIFGGDRTRRNDVILSVDGSRSTDPDNANLATPPLHYGWSCVVQSYVSTLAVVPPACVIPAGQVALPLITFPANSLTAGVTYSVSLRVTSSLPGDLREDTMSVLITAMTPPSVPTPIVLIVDAPRQINLQDTFKLQTFVVTMSSTPLYQLQYRWTCDPPLDLTDPALLGGLPNFGNLIVRPNVFQPGFRTFTITVTDPQYNTSASASALVSVNFPPVPGACTVTPSLGEAFSTPFYIECHDWYDLNGAEPFSYGLKYINLDHPEYGLLTLTQPRSQPYMNLVLPYGHLQLVVSINDTLGATSYVPLPVNTTLDATCLSCLLGCVHNLTETVLAEAIVAGDAETTSTLITGISALFAQVTIGSTTDCNGFTGLSVADVRHELLRDLDGTLTNGSCGVDSPEANGQLGDSLLLLTGSMASQPGSDADEQLAIDMTEAAIQGIGCGQVNATSTTAQLAQVASNLLTNCSRLDEIGRLVSELQDVILQGAIAGEYLLVLNTTNFIGSEVKQPLSGGVNFTAGDTRIIVPPAATADSAKQLTTINSGNIDTAIAATPTLVAKIVTYAEVWSACRPSQDGKSSPLTDVKVCIADARGICLANPDYSQSPIEIDLPITNSSYWNSALPVCPGDTPVNRSSLLECSFWNAATQTYSSEGCTNAGLTPDGQSLRCLCTHLTEFALLAKRAQADLSGCPTEPEGFGAWWYLIFLCLYSLCAIVAIVQFARVYHFARCQYWLITTEHWLIFAYCVFRAVNMLILYTLYRTMSLPSQTVLLGMPYVFLGWIYTFVIVAWAAIYTVSRQEKKAQNPFLQYQSRFIFVNSAISVILFVIFCAIAGSSDPDRIQTLANAGSMIIALVAIVFSALFLFYGYLLLDRLKTNGVVSKLGKKLAAVAIALATCFIICALLLIFSVAQTDAYNSSATALDITYYSFDWLAVVLVLLLFAKSINDAFRAPQGGAGYSIRRTSFFSTKAGSLMVSRIGFSLGSAGQPQKQLADDDDESELSSHDESSSEESGSDGDGDEKSTTESRTDSGEHGAISSAGTAETLVSPLGMAQDAQAKAKAQYSAEATEYGDDFHDLPEEEKAKRRHEWQLMQEQEEAARNAHKWQLHGTIGDEATEKARLARVTSMAGKLRDARLSLMGSAGNATAITIAGAATDGDDASGGLPESSKYARKKFFGLPTADGDTITGSPTMSAIGSPSGFGPLLSPSNVSLGLSDAAPSDLVLPGRVEEPAAPLFDGYGSQLAVGQVADVKLDSKNGHAWCLCEVLEETPADLLVREVTFKRGVVSAHKNKQWVAKTGTSVQPARSVTQGAAPPKKLTPAPVVPKLSPEASRRVAGMTLPVRSAESVQSHIDSVHAASPALDATPVKGDVVVPLSSGRTAKESPRLLSSPSNRAHKSEYTVSSEGTPELAKRVSIDFQIGSSLQVSPRGLAPPSGSRPSVGAPSLTGAGSNTGSDSHSGSGRGSERGANSRPGSATKAVTSTPPQAPSTPAQTAVNATLAVSPAPTAAAVETATITPPRMPWALTTQSAQSNPNASLQRLTVDPALGAFVPPARDEVALEVHAAHEAAAAATEYAVQMREYQEKLIAFQAEHKPRPMVLAPRGAGFIDLAAKKKQQALQLQQAPQGSPNDSLSDSSSSSESSSDNDDDAPAAGKGKSAAASSAPNRPISTFAASSPKNLHGRRTSSSMMPVGAAAASATSPNKAGAVGASGAKYVAGTVSSVAAARRLARSETIQGQQQASSGDSATPQAPVKRSRTTTNVNNEDDSSDDDAESSPSSSPTGHKPTMRTMTSIVSAAMTAHKRSMSSDGLDAAAAGSIGAKPKGRLQLLAEQAIAAAAEKRNRPAVNLAFGSSRVKGTLPPK
jgi:hypothetical protein